MTEAITQTIGLDLGDRFTAYCVLDQGTGEEVESGRIRTTPKALEQLVTGRPAARVVMEVGTHSPWASRIAARSCAQTYVANSRDLRFIFGNARKSDRVDAEALARVGRLDPQLLSPVRHRNERAQRDLAVIRARSALVSSRTKLVNALRGLVKSAGARLRPCQAETIGHRTREHLPEALQDLLTPLLLAIEFVSDMVAEYDRDVARLAQEHYPETALLTQVPGVGPLTALAYVLTLEDPCRYAKSRDVGAFLGMVPRRDQSGCTEKELRITKTGDAMMRTLLLQCAHWILLRRSPDCDLKRFGQRMAAKGGKLAKRKAAIAVARKLAVLLHALWRTGVVYEPNRNRTTAA